MDYQELHKRMSAQKVEMTAAERMAAYNCGEEVDFQPYTIQGPDPALANIYGFTTSQYAKNFDIMCEVIRRRREDFGLDTLNVGFALRTLGAALGSTLYVPENGIDRIEKHILMDYADFEKFEVIGPHNNAMMGKMLETAKRLKDKFPDMSISTNVVGPISSAISIRPVEMFLRDTRKNPEMAKRLLDYCVECSLKWVEAFHDEFGTVSISFNDPVTCMDVISMKQFKEFSLPYIIKLINGIDGIMGVKPGTHICGKTGPIWEDLADAGVGFFSIDNCEDLEEAKHRIGDKMRIAGNVPPVDVMMKGSIDDVIEACVSCLKKAADNPKGYLLNTGCQVPIGTPKENMEALIYAVREYGKGARLGCLPKGLEKVL